MDHILSSNYNRENWIKFLQNQFLPSDFSLRREQIDIDFQSKYIKPQAYWIGDCESLGDLAIIEIAHSSENDPRIGVSRDAFRLMAEHGLSKALFFFVSDNSNNYRFSLITLDLKLEGTDVKYKFSNPKRFSFFLGEEAKIHTPEEFLFEKGRIKDFEDLQSRFSIEVVNKEFYHEIQRLFYKLVGGKVNQGSKKYDFTPMLKLPSTNDHQTMQEFSVRLVGRLVFCWFLKKKKSDAGIPLIPEKILSSDAIERDYYHNTIEPLFFELLNTPIDERRNDFRNSEFDLIPFLNGGLFDPNLHEDYYRYSPMEKEYKPSYNLVIPDEWLEEFITLLETYNFTIDENTSIDIDLSVDPEMLGRIFENLLAEINPETGNTARKATGSYYTPRPIVEYMVDESLIQYLLSKTGIEETAIRELLDYNIEGTELPKDSKIAVIDALDEIKVLDPACGSGAFPMGILQKMLLILQKVDPESVEWVIRQLDKIPNKLVRKALEDKLMNENWKYKHKMGIIQNAIYGVDIQPIATEISKLRLFLTLIVDENIIDEKANRNIHPLPNLSFKFVTANTLIGLGKTPDLDDWTIKHAYEECVTDMEEVREQYFYEFDKSKKVQLEYKIKDIQKKLYNIVIEHQIHSKYFNKLISWNPFEDKASGWFDPSWMFGIKSGFDIVLGNPPYVSAVSMKRKDNFKEIVKREYPQLSGSYDLYTIFVLKGAKLLSSTGIFTWIIPNKFLVSDYAQETKKHLIKKGLLYSIDVSSFRVFGDTGVYPIIIMGSKSSKNANFKTYILKNFNDLIRRKFEEHKKIKKYKSFKDFGFKIQSGTTGFQAQLVKRLVSETKSRDSIPFIVSGSVDRYSFSNKNVKYMKSIFKEAYVKYDDSIAASKWEFWNNEKLVVAGMTKVLEATYSELPLALGVGIYGISNTHNFDFLCILALLNSKFFTHFLKTNFRDKHLAGGYLAINKSTIEKLPLVDISKKTQEVLSNCAKIILNNKKQNTSSTEMENLIDLIVYKLYDNSFEEIKIFDPEIGKILVQFGLSKEDYESMSVEELGELEV